MLRVGRVSAACRVVGCVVVGVARRRGSVIAFRGGWVGTLQQKGGDKMFYRILEMVQDGQRATFEYDAEDRDKMLEWAKLLLAQSDTAYIDVMLIDDDGTCINRKFIEGRAYETFIDNI